MQKSNNPEGAIYQALVVFEVEVSQGKTIELKKKFGDFWTSYTPTSAEANVIFPLMSDAMPGIWYFIK